MESKFVVKNMGPEFYTGLLTFKGLNNMKAKEKLETLENLACSCPKNVKKQDASFKFVVEAHGMMRDGCEISHSVSPRRGYEVHTFTFTK